MSSLISWLVRQLGTAGLSGLALIGACAVFMVLFVRPLERESLLLDEQARGASAPFPKKVLRAPAHALPVFYDFFQRSEHLEDWLSKLYATAVASGLDFRTAEYRLVESRYRIDRFQINVPVSGSYRQVRGFIDRALLEIPIMSVDQISLRRKTINDTSVDADIVVTLYLFRR